MTNTRFTEIQWQSELHQQEIRLRDEVLRRPLGLAFTPEQLAAEENELRYGIIDETTDQLIACVLAVRVSDSRIKLRQMAVAESYRKQGVGTYLITSVHRILKTQSFLVVELNARQSAIGFYEKLGYRCEGDEFTEVGIPHSKMTYRLSESL